MPREGRWTVTLCGGFANSQCGDDGCTRSGSVFEVSIVFERRCFWTSASPTRRRTSAKHTAAGKGGRHSEGFVKQPIDASMPSRVGSDRRRRMEVPSTVEAGLTFSESLTLTVPRAEAVYPA